MTSSRDGRSSANAEVRPKHSAKCSARQHVTIRPNFGKNLSHAEVASLRLRHFALAAHVNMKSLYSLLVTSYNTYQVTNIPGAICMTRS